MSNVKLHNRLNRASAEKIISKEFQIIKNSYEYRIFDDSKIIENAKEIHVMESSARCMLEYLNTENSKHFLYNFIDGPWKSMPFKIESKRWKRTIKKLEINKSKL